ncbi:hypothetical protein PVAND_004545 [Polypedilum vanderplanki]|uniref:Uncharacterized protein n=1 Tax=Polypedilum vanderplanki TaxID=319348 RepID=A0A9J6BXJ3_POLVA|nr:hypothetical protein PVAND_004545 [Polypedilum vanderplanki]
MIKFRRVLLVLVIIIRSSLTENLATAKKLQLSTTKIPSIATNRTALIAAHEANSNSSLKTAESRLFPIGHPSLIPQPGSLVSPFDVATFSNSLLPLISAGIREKVKGVAQTFNDGVDLVEDAIRDGWRQSPLNPHNFEAVLNRPPNLFENLPNLIGLGQPQIPLFPPQHALHKHPKHNIKLKEKEKTLKGLEPYTQDDIMNEYGIKGYKHFEESILREIEKQEEAKVEATIHTLFNEGDRFEIIKGKHYEDDKTAGWKPVAAPTKNYESDNDITSQIISPLHTSIFDETDESNNKLGFHDFDTFHYNSISSSYSVNEEGDETKVKPVKAKIASIGRITPQPIHSTYSPSSTSTLAARSTTTRSRGSNTAHKRRQITSRDNQKADQDDKITKNKSFYDASTSASNEVPVVIAASVKRIVPPQSRAHIQSLTTSKPKNHANFVRNVTEFPRFTSISSEGSSTTKDYGFESTSRFRLLSSSRSTRSTTTTTTKKPSRTVQREVSKYVDKARATGFRGSVKYGQSTTKNGDQN